MFCKIKHFLTLIRKKYFFFSNFVHQQFIKNLLSNNIPLTTYPPLKMKICQSPPFAHILKKIQPSPMVGGRSAHCYRKDTDSLRMVYVIFINLFALGISLCSLFCPLSPAAKSKIMVEPGIMV